METLLLEKGPLSAKLAAMTSEQFSMYELFSHDDARTAKTASTIQKLYQRTFVSELSTMLSRFGCGHRAPYLTDTLLIKSIEDFAATSAESITNTYNFALARRLLSLDASKVTKTIVELRSWRKKRLIWKKKQIDQWTIGTAKKVAAKEFVERNKFLLDFSKAEARLFPRKAKEPICMGWSKRGWFPMLEAIDNAPPYHLNCPHYFKYRGVKMDAVSRLKVCPRLWIGGN